jgi:hypothetical protein
VNRQACGRTIDLDRNAPHTHVKVLANLAERPPTGWQVHLVTPYRRQIYSVMLPG